MWRRCVRLLSISADHEVVPIGTIKSQNIEDDNAFGRINNLADAQQRGAFWHTQKFGGSGVGGGSVNFFVGIAELDVIIALQGGEQRFFLQRGGLQSGKLFSGEIASLKSKRLAASGVPQALQFKNAASGRKG